MEVSLAEARRIAVRAQLLDGSAKSVLETVRHLGWLQIDPISTVAPPQYLVLWSRLGPYDRAELDRLLWERKQLFEWRAFIYPIDDLPLIRALMRAPWGRLKRHEWAREFMKAQAGRVPATPVTFLSPFDGLVKNRDRAEALWDFFYRLEMYVPKAKREYGYYVLPILRGDRLVGRIEPAFDRKTGVLRVLGVFAEPGAPAGAGPGIAAATRRLGKWLGATDILYPRKVPAIWREALR